MGVLFALFACKVLWMLQKKASAKCMCDAYILSVCGRYASVGVVIAGLWWRGLKLTPRVKVKVS